MVDQACTAIGNYVCAPWLQQVTGASRDSGIPLTTQAPWSEHWILCWLANSYGSLYSLTRKSLCTGPVDSFIPKAGRVRHTKLGPCSTNHLRARARAFYWIVNPLSLTGCVA